GHAARRRTWPVLARLAPRTERATRVVVERFLLRGPSVPWCESPERAPGERRRPQLLARPRGRTVGLLRAARGDPGRAGANGCAACGDRRGLDGRVRRARPGTDRAAAVLRGGRSLRGAVVPWRRHTAGRVRRSGG